MTFVLQYHEKVIKHDIPRLSNNVQQKIKSAIEKKLLVSPELFGIPLRKSLKGYRKLRVGDYRVIFYLHGTMVKILVIQHRSIVYSSASKRVTSKI